MIDPFPHAEDIIVEIKGLSFGNKPSLIDVYHMMKKIMIKEATEVPRCNLNKKMQ